VATAPTGLRINSLATLTNSEALNFTGLSFLKFSRDLCCISSNSFSVASLILVTPSDSAIFLISSCIDSTAPPKRKRLP
jgi:hypothetical protein